MASYVFGEHSGERNGVLELKGIAKSFGELRAVDDVTLRIDCTAITGLIGPNGAGKTTLFNIIAGAIRADRGVVLFNGRETQHLRADQIYGRGVGRTFQIPRVFPSMSVLENVMTAPLNQKGERFWSNWFIRREVESEERLLQAKAQEILAFTQLDSLSSEPASSLSGGQMKLLELARVLMGDPKLILLDEPGAGVNPSLLQVLMAKIEEINARGIGFLIIEHNMELIGKLCKPVVAMAQGQVIFEGSAAEAQNDPNLLEIYLGHWVA